MKRMKCASIPCTERPVTRLTPRVNSMTAAVSSSITMEIGSQAMNSNASTAPCKASDIAGLPRRCPRNGNHLDGRVADEFDIVVNGIEYEIKLPLLHGRIKRRQPSAQNVGHCPPSALPRASIANSARREKQPSVARAPRVTAAG
jgi:hypothetical protein